MEFSSSSSSSSFQSPIKSPRSESKMESLSPSSFQTPIKSFRSKKPFDSPAKTHLSDQKKSENIGLLSSKTPEKSSRPPRTSRNPRSALFTVNQVKKCAQSLNKSSDPDPIAEKQNLSTSIETPVPKSNVWRSASAELPKNYEILLEFFHSLDSSIRLLKLKGSVSTFSNICPKIQCLTDRRFTYSHLAQLKYLLPEVILTEKILTCDEKAHCTKPDLHITLDKTRLETDGKIKSESGNSHLRKIFRARLLEFFKAHPEGDDVPEEVLPEPFNQSKQDAPSSKSGIAGPSVDAERSTDALSEEQPSIVSFLPKSFHQSKQVLRLSKTGVSGLTLVAEPSNQAILQKQPINVSLLPKSFRRGFSQRLSNVNAENSLKKPSEFSLQSAVPDAEPSPSISSSEEEDVASAFSSAVKDLANSDHGQVQISTPSNVLATPIKKVGSSKSVICPSPGMTIVTPAKLASSPAEVTSVTPALQPPKRCRMSPEDEPASTPNKLVRRPLRTRSLVFDTPVKVRKERDESNNGGDSIDNDILDILPESLLQSIRKKEKKNLEEQDPAISRAKRRREMIACLPKLFNMIHLFFQSSRRSVITKEELIHKLLSSHCDIVDKREVEEQLDLLQELAPEWIFEKKTASGDFLLCINKISSADSIRARLAAAK
ncbi:DNA replication factor Cdt1, C-terminal [Dillenia turbinata]|uniref:DNA replication factor Cdt1, C-terminal n=1 Tax=Dillenia turbinata TaxID=194707 RepID=A0AAN8ZEH9_9MAGN